MLDASRAPNTLFPSTCERDDRTPRKEPLDRTPREMVNRTLVNSCDNVTSSRNTLCKLYALPTSGVFFPRVKINIYFNQPRSLRRKQI